MTAFYKSDCPQWACPHLSVEDRRDGDTCAVCAPCTCDFTRPSVDALIAAAATTVPPLSEDKAWQMIQSHNSSSDVSGKAGDS